MRSLPRIKAEVIVFDQGNTLLMDPFSSVLELLQGQLQKLADNYGLSISALQIANQWARSNQAVDYPFAGHFYQEEPIIQDALRNLGITEEIVAILGLELLREYRIGLRKIIEADPRTPEVRGTLETLRTKGKRLGVFSNDKTVGLGFVLNIMRIKQYFEYIETSESLGIEKPDPRVFKHIVKFFNVEPATVLYVGDDPWRDIEAAKINGLKAIQYRLNIEKYWKPWRDYKLIAGYEADGFIDNFRQLLKIIE